MRFGPASGNVLVVVGLALLGGCETSLSVEAAPEVDAGPDRRLLLGEAAVLTASASGAADPAFEWQVVSPAGAAGLSDRLVATVVFKPESAGLFVLSVRVRDQGRESAKDYVSVTVVAPEDCPDADGDGHRSARCGGDDCDDADPQVRPGATELAGNDVDEDCDGARLCHRDADHDGYGGSEVGPVVGPTCADPGAGHAVLPDDCDDGDADEKPGARWYPDADGDGHGALGAEGRACERQAPSDVSTATDCADGDGAIHPGATEVAGDGTDQDCDGREVCYVDGDGDGHGDPNLTGLVDGTTCALAGWSAIGDDCDDGRLSVHPEAGEVPGDGRDQDCDGQELCWADVDQDGYGSDVEVSIPAGSCSDPAAGVAANSDDCNDADAAQKPGVTWYPDADGDGYGSMAAAGHACSKVAAGDVTRRGDCNDGDAAIRPGVSELPGDGVDQNCDGVELCFVDGDGDGYGTSSTVSVPPGSCTSSGRAAVSGDCEDGDASVHPGAVELVGDGVDQDCDGFEACWTDEDGDGYGTGPQVLVTGACSPEGGSAGVYGDCDDTDPAVNPGAVEGPPGDATCSDGIDQDCDGAADRLDPDCAPPSTCGWWDSAWGYRRRLIVAAGAALPEAYTLFATFDHGALVLAGKSRADGADVRVVRCAGGTNTERHRLDDLPHMVPPEPDSWNGPATRIAFAAQSAVAAGAVDDEYFVYYGNPNAGAPPASWAQIYLWWDDFSTDTLTNYDLNRWVNIFDEYDAPTWDPDGQRLVFDTGNDGQSDFWPKTLEYTDVLIEVRYGATYAYQADALFAVGVRVDPGSSGSDYYLHMSTGTYASPGIARRSWSNGARNTLVYGAVPSYYWSLGQSHVLRYAVWGDRHAFWWNATLAQTPDANVLDPLASSGSINQGRFGIAPAQMRGWVDRLRARMYRAPEPTVLVSGEEP